MASWTDILLLVVILATVGGVVYGIVFVSQTLSSSMESTKAKLKDRGLDISKSGVSVKTSGRVERDDYIDATQRGFIKAMNAGSFRKDAHPSPSVHGSASTPERKDSTASLDEKKKRKLFGRK
ncbi:hypothetical protein BD626DRAFT_555377 [Schizophyllum amplum]|uniref:Uncharacterized protein n=1 Tax=Schizophyllum amplum TaxID=97359 RepID=A0A550CNY3_9AGAR|nr:hypothetical protein BD626DRAFT_555377 [Auriculariopsis ampla]